MCLIVTILLFGFAIQSLMQEQWLIGIFQLLVSFGFLALLIRNIMAVRNQKQGCNTAGCSGTEWFTNLFKRKKEK